MWVWSLDQENLLDWGMATYSSILSWRIPWTEESGRLWSIELQRVGHDWSDLALMHAYSIFIHLAVEGLLSCFHVLVIVNSAVVDIGVHVSFWISIFVFFPNIYPGVELLDHMVVLFLVSLWNQLYCFPSCPYQVAFPPIVKEGSLFSASSPAFVICRVFDNSLSDRHEVISLCFFDLHFSNN